MIRLSCLSLAVVLAFAGCSQPSPEQSVLNAAVEALGGEERIAAVRSVTIEGEGTQFNLGQDTLPGASAQTFTATEYRRRIDLTALRARTELTRTANFAYFQGTAPQRQVQGIDGDTGYNVGANGNATRASAAVSQDRLREFYHHPLTILQAAMDPASTLANGRTEGSERMVDITTPRGVTVTLAIDASTGLPASVASKAYHANLGDIVITTTFADYQDINGLKMPATLATKTDDFTTAEVRATRQAVDEDIGDLAGPEAPPAMAPPTMAPPTMAPPTMAPASAQPAVTVTAEPVGAGVWLLAGQSHHSLLVEFSDHLMLIEAPQSEARTLAVISRARELRPDKPLTKVVTTHHHFDHTAGLRAAISEGLSVITHRGNQAFVEEMAARPHTIQPDALARNPQPVTVETVDEQLELTDATMTVVLYHVAGNPHSDTMLMAYIPRDRILVEVDAFSPGSQVQPYAANLLENITRRQLRVNRIVPLHGTIAPFSDLTSVVAASRD